MTLVDVIVHDIDVAAWKSARCRRWNRRCVDHVALDHIGSPTVGRRALRSRHAWQSCDGAINRSADRCSGLAPVTPVSLLTIIRHFGRMVLAERSIVYSQIRRLCPGFYKP
jgi:hypothetical protein